MLCDIHLSKYLSCFGLHTVTSSWKDDPIGYQDQDIDSFLDGYRGLVRVRITPKIKTFDFHDPLRSRAFSLCISNLKTCLQLLMLRDHQSQRTINLPSHGEFSVKYVQGCVFCPSKHFNYFAWIYMYYLFVSFAKHSGTKGSLCPASVCPSICLCVCPVVTLSW